MEHLVNSTTNSDLKPHAYVLQARTVPLFCAPPHSSIYINALKYSPSAIIAIACPYGMLVILMSL
jgi:hypothetical protein